MQCAFSGIKITGLSSCVPRKIVQNNESSCNMTSEEVRKLIENIGIKERRIADNDVTASDLCYRAGETLIEKLQIDRSEINALVFMSQTPDYLIPATAPILQSRLGLSHETACFDLGLACSGYVYALFVCYSLLQNRAINNVLLLDGETFSKHTNYLDKVNYPLYGDAGTATLISKCNNEDISYFSLNTDGSGYKAVIIESGAYRNPIDKEGLETISRGNGNSGRSNDIYMDAIEVFNFTMREVPKSVKKILSEAQMTINEVDYYCFHQANKFMTDFFAKKLKIPLEKMLYSLDVFGNTSSASIPLTLSHHQRNWSKDPKRVLLSGFGGGLSWANAIITIEDAAILAPVEY